MPLILIFALIILAIGLVYLVYSLVWGTPPFIHWAVERLALQMTLADPETLTYLGLVDNTLLDFHSGKLTDVSPHQIAHIQQLEREGLMLIRRYDPERLRGQSWITYHLMHWYFSNHLYGHRFDYHWPASPAFIGPYPVNHVFGVQSDLIHFLCTYHKIRGWRSVRRYISRLRRVDWKLTGLRESLQVRESMGVLPPRFVLEKSLAQIEAFISSPVKDNPLFTSFMSRLVEAASQSERSRRRWEKQVLKVIEEKVLPAYQELQSYLLTQLENATEEDGVWKLPDGKAYYEFLLRYHTTTELTAEEIHQLGLREVDLLTERIRAVLSELGLPDENPGKQLRALMSDPDHKYQGENGRQTIIDDYQSILDEVNQYMPGVFHQGMLEEISVKRLPEYREADSPIALAEAPALDGSRPGKMWVNLRDPDNIYRWGMRTLAYHEGIPGHVYQMALAQKIKGIPTFRQAYFFTAYVEGWALYAERLAWELRLTDTYSNLGRLQALLWRAARLVVDTGIHAYKWTRQQAIDYMLETTGLPERDVITEVERYIVMPGQACAYYIGYLKMCTLRQKTEVTLGEAFNLKDFHAVVINNGGLPLTLLESLVNDHVDQVTGLISIDH